MRVRVVKLASMRGRGAMDWERPAWVRKWAMQTIATRAPSRRVDIGFDCVLRTERGEGAETEGRKRLGITGGTEVIVVADEADASSI